MIIATQYNNEAKSNGKTVETKTLTFNTSGDAAVKVSKVGLMLRKPGTW